MKIVFVTDTYYPDVNGVAMTLGRLVKGLRGKGHDVHIIHTAQAGGDEDETPMRGFGLPGYKEVRVGLPKPLRFKKRWQEDRPDVVYVATESPMGGSAVKACRKLGLPVVMGFHTNFDQYLSRYRLQGIRPMAVAYLRKAHARADRTLVPAQDVKDRLEECGFDRLKILGRGVDTQLFSPEKRSQALRSEWGARSATPVAMVVGRVAAEKNLELAMRAFEKMVERVPDLKCVIVGDGPIRAALEKKYPWVVFAGIKNGESLAAHYASADILLFPSETETFGNVVLEGMASGLVTVTYDYAASAAHVKSEVSGLKAPLGDEDAFITQSISALDLRKWSKLRQRARRDVAEMGWDRIVNCFEDHLNAVVSAKSEVFPKKGMPQQRGKYVFRTVFLSDLHLGTPDSKAEEACEFLKSIKCQTLVLNGDIIDGWALKRGAKWLGSHTKFVRQVLKKMDKEGTKIIYLRGNHDEIMERFLPLAIGGLEMTKEYIHQSVDGRRYLVVHGDGFDQISVRHRWLAHVGAVGYDWLLKFNRFYNWYRSKRGLDYYSFSKAVKSKVKASVSFVGRYEEQLQIYARRRDCDGIICGHIHTPANEMVGGIHYLNSGDWVESLTGIVEHEDGLFEVVSYEDFRGWEATKEVSSPRAEVHSRILSSAI
jgi:UDP-2,3-diacylglucosamine pyrophosphatase LpxH/glycosyltransferase involved in cell wall biosynthesis